MLSAMRRSLLVLSSAFGIGLTACASDAVPAAPVAEWRVLVKLVQPASDGVVIAQHASRVAGVSVHYLSPASAQWHSLSLACGDEGRCAAALQSLRADTTTFEAVERDERRRPHSKPP